MLYFTGLLSSLVIILFTYTVVLQCEPKGNIFTAISHMEPLIDLEARLVDLAKQYLDKERQKLDGLKQFAKSVEEAVKLSKNEPLKYLGNPVNSYLIIKRFASGWRELASRLEVDDTKMEEIKTVLKSNEQYLPTYEIDVIGATASILRLQDTYNITAREVADGNIKDISRSAHQLTAEDCKNIAEHAHNSRRYVRMKEWSEEAMRIMDNNPKTSYRIGNVTRLQIYELLGWCYYLSNNMPEALRYTNLVLKENPLDEKAIKNDEFYRFYQKENIEHWLTEEQWDYAEDKKYSENFQIGSFVELCTKKTKLVKDYRLQTTGYRLQVTDYRLQITDPKDEKALKNKAVYEWYKYNNKKSSDKQATWMDAAQNVLNTFVESDYVQACRNNNNPKTLKVKNPSSLVCYYTNKRSSLILKPIKTTRMHDNPEVLIYHDVVSNKEIAILKKLSTPYLRQAQVVNPDDSDEFIEADYRIAKTMFLMEEFPEAKRISEKLNKRFEAMTGLDMQKAERLQINNYGLGGQYEFHIDHGPEGSFLALHTDGNRLATILCYLSDVERGGETVFTKLGLSIPPKKGDTVFWYNLHSNGDGNSDTEHASCPVVSGSKWVANKWIHQHGNEFRRKCQLNRNK